VFALGNATSVSGSNNASHYCPATESFHLLVTISEITQLALTAVCGCNDELLNTLCVEQGGYVLSYALASKLSLYAT
jgi:hypothetical protein